MVVPLVIFAFLRHAVMEIELAKLLNSDTGWSKERVTDQTGPARTVRGNDALKAWAAGGDASVAIGTLRVVVAETGGLNRSHWAYELARVLQGEGRTEEAAALYWASCRIRQGTEIVNRWKLTPSAMSRVADALEDAGRREDADWVYREMGATDRRSGYELAHNALTTQPGWSRKWTLRILKDDPTSARWQARLRELDAEIASLRARGALGRDTPR